MSKTLYPLHCHLQVQPRKIHPNLTEKCVDWDVKNQTKQKSTNDEIVFSIPQETALKGRNSLPSGSEFFPLREVPILKRDAISEIHSSLYGSLTLVRVTIIV